MVAAWHFYQPDGLLFAYIGLLGEACRHRLLPMFTWCPYEDLRQQPRAHAAVSAAHCKSCNAQTAAYGHDEETNMAQQSLPENNLQP